MNKVRKATATNGTPKRQKLRNGKKSAKAKKEPATPVKKEKAVKVKKEKDSPSKKQASQEEEEVSYKWWLEEVKDNTIKWNTLEHNGPAFPPEYTPHGVKMLYDNVPVVLSPAAEEVATFYAALQGTDWIKNPIFQKNFFHDFLNVVKSEKNCPIKKLELCDFTPITNHLQKIKEERKSMTKEQKLVLKEEKQKIEDKHGWCLLDGRREKIGNYNIEPPGLFLGRGEHPKAGTLKLRVTPEQVTINISKDAPIPKPPYGSWGAVVHDNEVTWLANWKENVNDLGKYVHLAANSSLKGLSDYKKFEKARELKQHISKIRQEYERELKDELMATRQRATALYFIDRLALRAGHEKGEDTADTVGCCSLRFEHVTLKPPNIVVFDFLGKDSIRYYNEVEVIPQVFKNLKLFKKEPKKEGDAIFDRLNVWNLNPDRCVEQTFEKLYGWVVSESISYIQCIIYL
jgi:DNA topoisomerase-1